MHIPEGFSFAGVYTGVKKKHARDLSLVVSDVPAVAAGRFTTNRVKAAPVQVCITRLPDEKMRAVITNSGNANACTGDKGLADAIKMVEAVSEQLQCDRREVLICSTGIIGHRLDMPKILTGIDHIVGELGQTDEHVQHAAEGILTTDHRTKIADRQVTVSGGTVTLLGMAKGAGMIGPNMATMLATVVTDAPLSTEQNDKMLGVAVDQSFHCISVDGHTSTNDTVYLLANGRADLSKPLDDLDLGNIQRALTEMCQQLAADICDDAEGAEHLIQIDVQGTHTFEDAHRIAKTVADSPLVKTAVFGNDPNWGRICSAAGYAGVPFAEAELSLAINDHVVYQHGQPVDFEAKAVSRSMKENRKVRLELSLQLGSAGCRFWTCDLTTEYVRFNAEYTT